MSGFVHCRNKVVRAALRLERAALACDPAASFLGRQVSKIRLEVALLDAERAVRKLSACQSKDGPNKGEREGFAAAASVMDRLRWDLSQQARLAAAGRDTPARPEHG